MPAKIVINASGISPDVLIWLMQAKDGHYYIERKPNRAPSATDRFRVPDEKAKAWQALPVEEAWKEMERFVGVAPI